MYECRTCDTHSVAGPLSTEMTLILQRHNRHGQCCAVSVILLVKLSVDLFMLFVLSNE